MSHPDDPDPWWADDAEPGPDWDSWQELMAPTRDECRWIEQQARRNR